MEVIMMHHLLCRTFLKLAINYFDTDEIGTAETTLLATIALVTRSQASSADFTPSPTNGNYDDDNGSSYLSFVKNNEPATAELYNELMEAYNYLGMIWANRTEQGKAEQCFKKAEETLMTFMSKYNNEAFEKIKLPGFIPHMDGTKTVKKQLEEHQTMTNFYLAQLYTHLGIHSKAAQYCYKTLNQQLESGLLFDKAEWAQNCMQLSSFYAKENDFAHAEHCIIASQKVLLQQQQNSTSAAVAVDAESSSKTEKSDNEAMAVANLSLAFARLYTSKLRYCNNEFQKHLSEGKSFAECSKLPAVEILPNAGSELVPVEFKSLNIGAPKKQIVVFAFDKILPMFKEARTGYETALKYYVLDGYVSDHVGIILDFSTLYRLLTNFETDIDRRM